MTNSKDLFFNYLAQTSNNPIGLEVHHAEGNYIYGSDGKKYLDLISGISVSSAGHLHPSIKKSILGQLEQYLHVMVYGEFIQHSQTSLAKLLCDQLPESLNSVFFVNSGSEAVEGALKLSKRFNGRPGIISFHNAYHGCTSGALSVCGNENQKNSFRPLIPDVTFLNLNNHEDIELISEKSSCVIIEPVQGEAGVIQADPDFMVSLHERCKKTGTLLIFDEVQTGLGRTGKMFAFEHYGVVPDILVLGKSLGGGLPLGAFVSDRKIMATLTTGPVLGHITTTGGNPLCCAAGLGMLDFLLNTDVVGQIENKAAIFAKRLNHPVIKEFRYKGFLMAAELKTGFSVKAVIERCLENGLILDWFLFNENSIRIAPPFTITETEIEWACRIIIDALNQAG